MKAATALVVTWQRPLTRRGLSVGSKMLDPSCPGPQGTRDAGAEQLGDRHQHVRHVSRIRVRRRHCGPKTWSGQVLAARGQCILMEGASRGQAGRRTQVRAETRLGRFSMGSGSGCFSCYSETPRLGACKQHTGIVPSSGGWTSKTKALAWSGEDPLPDSRLDALCRVLRGGRAGGALWGLSYKDSNPIARAPHSRPNHPPESPLLTPSFWGRGSAQGFRGDTNMRP